LWKKRVPSRSQLEKTRSSETTANKLDVRGSVHHSTIHKKKSNKMQQCIKILIIPYLYEAQHVSGDTPPCTHEKPEAPNAVLDS
jgi:hypothetical protein